MMPSPNPAPNAPSDQVLVEILAVEGMGWIRWHPTAKSWKVIGEGFEYFRNFKDWNPLADPEGMGPIREVEKGLTPKQWLGYISLLSTIGPTDANRYEQFLRHASPRDCVTALARVLRPEAFKG